MGDGDVFIRKFMSFMFDMPRADYTMLTLDGGWAKEAHIHERPVSFGILVNDFTVGASSNRHNPAFMLKAKDATETHGEVYGFNLVYSGNHYSAVEMGNHGTLRVMSGINPHCFLWKLKTGESFVTPQAVMSFSDEGVNAFASNMHVFVNEHIINENFRYSERPIVINNWEATFFNFNRRKLLALAKEAKMLGVETFVLDDGWFGKRNSDTAGLGDWTVNEKKLPGGITYLADRINNMGMRFGLWFEPEAISEHSELYRQHPEWAIIQPGRKPCLSRNQLILDMSNPQVQDYLIDRLTDILFSAPISYVKWDMNRSICDKYSATLGKDRQGEFAHRYVLGLYRVLESVYQKFPNGLVEGCSGGGGRFDAGMLYYTPQIWTSDNSDAIARLSIQYGTSFGYPVSAMGAHVSAVPNHQTGRVTPLETRGVVAMAGTFGYELDITKMLEEEKRQVKEQIASFHRFYDVIQYGDYYRLSSPFDRCTAWEMVKEDASEALLSVVYNRIEANQELPILKLQGLIANAEYMLELVNKDLNRDVRITDWCERNKRISGTALLKGGIRVPNALREYQSFQIYLKKCEE